MSSKNKRNFILQGSILAMAGIFVRIIGMVYRIPVLNIIGSEGNGIYGTAFNVYNLSLIHISEPTRRNLVSRMPSSA